MTQKDLLYMEDGINHEANLVSICEYYLEIAEDSNLKSFIKAQIKKHLNLKNKILKTMEDVSNE